MVPNSSPAKVLVLGREPSDFLCGLYRGIREATGIAIDLLELRGVPERHQTQALASFGTIHSPEFLRLRNRTITSHLRHFSPGTLINKVSRFEGLSAGLRGALIAGPLRKLFSHYDMIHVQQLTPEVLQLLEFAPNECLLAFTFWGADLFSGSAHFPAEMQAKLLKRAQLITVHSSAMQLVLHAKFGSLEHSIVKPLIAVPADDVFDRIDRVRHSGFSRAQSRAKLGITEGEVAVIVGGSALASGRHLEIIDALVSLDAGVRQRFHFVFPLTYGAPNEDYVAEIGRRLTNGNVKHTLLQSFMTQEEVALLRMSADVSIKVPHYDSLSLAMCEDIYAGCIPVVGAWLPYGVLRAAGVYMAEVERVADLSSFLPKLLTEHGALQRACGDNALAIRQLLSRERIVSNWASVYKEVLTRAVF